MRTRGLTVLSVLALFAACDKGESASTTPAPEAAPARPSFSADSDIGATVLTVLDANVNPCDDFYAFACGGWLANTQLPSDSPRYGRGFSVIQDRNNEVLKELLEQAAAAPNSPTAKAGAFYASCMDEAGVDAQGIKPLQPYLTQIAALKSPKELMKLVGKLHMQVFEGGGVLFNFNIDFDAKKPDLLVLSLGQGGTGLPERSYYLDEAKKPVLDAYAAHIERMLKLLGDDEAKVKDAAARIVAFETKLATIQKKPEELRDPKATYNPTDAKGVKAMGGKLDFAGYFKALGYGEKAPINVSVPSFVEGLGGAIDSTDVATLQDYLRFHLISSAAGTLDKTTDETAFMFTAALTGQKQQKARWKRCIDASLGALGDVVAQGYIEKKFAGDSKDIALSMIGDVEGAFEAGLPALSWMDDDTRKAALEKMGKITNKIGYPNKWRDYSKLAVGTSYFDNAAAAGQFEYRYWMDMAGKSVDKDVWFMPAPIVNAYYNPPLNEIVFPAGILQEPFFHRDFPKAMNFGAMGMVMGHELTHGFDDQGRQYDGDGVLREWWSPEVTKQFEERAACVEQTYAAIEVQPGVKLNGKLTAGENIADFGGIKETTRAYRAWVAANGEEPALIKGMTNEQLLFVAYAQSWCSLSTPEMDALMASVDPHSPPKQRVNVPLSHLPEFWQTWSCDENTAMHATNACEVW